MKLALRLVGLFSGIVLLLLAAGTFVPRPLWIRGASPVDGPTHRILVVTNAIHTDIAIPLDDEVRTLFGFLRDDGMPTDAPGARYLLIGWGGRDFYVSTPTWSQLRLVPLLKGITVDRSVIHVDLIGDLARTSSAIAEFDLAPRDFDALTAFIAAGFTGPEGRPVVLPGIGYGEYDAFYEANGYFTALAGCNIWAAAALRAGGLRTGWWNPLPALLLLSLGLYN